MLVQTATIARNTFVESVRQPVVFVIIMVAAVAQIFATASTAFSMGLSETSEVESDTKLLLDIGLSSVFGFATLLAAFVATAVMSKEIENKTVLTIVSKPVGRPWVILGKYLGVATTILIATLTMLLFLLLAVRHGVLSTAADEADGPVLLFSFIALALSFGLATWCNFFYGWSFPQTVVLLLLPCILLAYIGVLFVGKEWKLNDAHAFAKDFKPQVMLACTALIASVLVLCAIATAASVRLGQVMTIVVCVGVFLASLMSDFFVGRLAFDNDVVARIKTVENSDPKRPDSFGPEQRWTITLVAPPEASPVPGNPVYYGPAPSGFPLRVPTFTPYTGNPKDQTALFNSPSPALVLSDVLEDKTKLVIAFAGNEPMPGLTEPPQPDDYLFFRPTRVNYAAATVWAAFPNLQRFWLLDAITQNQKIPLAHVGRILIYALLQVCVFVSLAIMLFQKRDVG
jgi:ABC-type transport system involved in multi-copper enzyme maturation permease subunit